MYLIFLQESIYHSGTSFSLMRASCSGVNPFPLRTLSIILKDGFGSKPFFIKYIIISSRQQIASFKVTIPCFIISCALLSHTSVPCDKPEILINSSKVVGLVSSSIPRTNFVPNSGTPKLPTSEFICSFVNPKASVDLKILIVSLSSSGIFVGSTPVIS